MFKHALAIKIITQTQRVQGLSGLQVHRARQANSLRHISYSVFQGKIRYLRESEGKAPPRSGRRPKGKPRENPEPGA